MPTSTNKHPNKKANNRTSTTIAKRANDTQMVSSTSTTNLVRPRATMQDSTQSLSLNSKHHNPLHDAKHPKRSIVVLSLFGMCMFLFILCACLVTALVLVGRSLSTNPALMSAGSERTKASRQSITASTLDNTYLLSIKDFASKLIPSSTIEPSTTIFSYDTYSESASDFGTSENITVRTMRATPVSKILDQLTWRLPKHIRPTLYNLLLRPDFKTKTFSGDVSIHLNVTAPISFVAVNHKQLSITKTTLLEKTSNGERNVEIATAFDYPEREYWVTELDKPLAIGEYILNLDFNGSLDNRIVGFYQSSYIDVNTNETRYIATSKFEPTYARQGFPCFDEPSMKAQFNVSIIRPNDAGYTALSNMDVLREVPNVDNTTTVVFNQSVPMSTYLVCFIVSDLISKQLPIKANGIGKDFHMSVYARPSEIEKATFALEAGVKVTEFFIQYFQKEYPLPKLDMAAIPDFVSGAMEHWGLVTFRETSMLVDDKTSSAANKQQVALTAAHELAHSWFGNLVTMAWWNELWLNEGFATYLQFKGVDKAFPEWKMTDQFLVSTLHSVLDFDAQLSSHPIVQVADNPDQITELFDLITYSKGASVIRMLANFVGEDNFAKGVTRYLNKYEYGNAVTDDLLTEVEAVDGVDVDVKAIMATWTKQSGYPVVNVEKISPTQYKLTQKRFLSNPGKAGSLPNDSVYKYRWTIPITYTTSNNSNQAKLQWFAHEDLEATINVTEDHNWLKLNKDQFGYYRVNYDAEDWKRLGDALAADKNQFSISDRAHLLNDAFSLAAASQLDYDTALDLTRYLKDETEYVPWKVAIAKLTELKRRLYYTEHHETFTKYAQRLIEPIYKSVGWTSNNDHTKNLLRSSVLKFACGVGLPDCLANSTSKFNAWLNSKVPLEADAKTTVYNFGISSNTKNAEQVWNKVFALYMTEPDAQEKKTLLYALAEVQIPWIANKFVHMAWDPKNVRGQDYFNCLLNIAENRIGEPIVWDYVREQWPEMVKRFGLNERYMGSMIPGITAGFSTETKLSEMKQFFEKYPEAGAGAAARKTALETVQNNIQWLQNNEAKVGVWLKAQTAGQTE